MQLLEYFLHSVHEYNSVEIQTQNIKNQKKEKSTSTSLEMFWIYMRAIHGITLKFHGQNFEKTQYFSQKEEITNYTFGINEANE